MLDLIDLVLVVAQLGSPDLPSLPGWLVHQVLWPLLVKGAGLQQCRTYSGLLSCGWAQGNHTSGSLSGSTKGGQEGLGWEQARVGRGRSDMLWHAPIAYNPLGNHAVAVQALSYPAAVLEKKATRQMSTGQTLLPDMPN